MRRRPLWGISFVVGIAAALGLSCGKRADPLAPFVRTPQAPGGLEVAQVGEEVEVRATAPRTTTEGRPLPVIDLQWLQAPGVGEFGKVAVSLFREEVAPGEIRTKRFKRPLSETRFSVRALSGKAESAPAAPLLYKPAAVPPSPTSLQATNTAVGVELRWTNPPAAEPWPSPTPNPSPKASPPTIAATPSPSASNPPTLPPAGFSPPPSPSPTPVAPLALPTGIRIFRSDGTPRLAREPLQASFWLDTSVKPGDKPCYSLRYAASLRPLVESAAGESVCVEVRDIVPPEAPGRPFGDVGITFVELSWVASASADVAFYRIYRSTETEARSVVIETAGPLLRVRDTHMVKGARTYEIVAVDKAGNESPPGPPLKIIVP